MVRLADQSAIYQLSHAFPGLFRQNVAGMTVTSHNLSRSRYFKSLCSTPGCLLHYKFLPNNNLLPSESRKRKLMLFRHENGNQSISFHFRRPFDIRDIFQFLDQLSHQLAAQFLVRHFSAAENDGSLRFVSFSQEAQNMVLFKLEIMLFRFRPKLHFFYNDLFLILFGLMSPLTLLVLEFAVIHDPAHGGGRPGSHLDKIHFLAPCDFQSCFRRHNSQLSGFFVDNPDFLGSNQFINTNSAALFGCCDWQPPYSLEDKPGNRLLWPHCPVFNESLYLLQKAFKGLRALIPMKTVTHGYLF
jgi:hypothetical protein